MTMFCPYEELEIHPVWSWWWVLRKALYAWLHNGHSTETTPTSAETNSYFPERAEELMLVENNEGSQAQHQIHIYIYNIHIYIYIDIDMPALDCFSLRSNLNTCFCRTFGGVHCFHTSLIVATCSQQKGDLQLLSKYLRSWHSSLDPWLRKPY
jgi:hypothetical protein